MRYRVFSLFAFCALAGGASAQASDPAFEVDLFADGFDEPIAMDFAADGRLFVAERGGRIWTVKSNGEREGLFAELKLYTENENGLLGLALDPQFDKNGFVYAFTTVSTQEQQILRLRAENGVGVEPTVIRANLPTRGGNHSGGGLKIGPDGKLYFSIGDNQTPANAQDANTLAGKIGRINLDGSTPSDNPFVTPTGAPRAIFASGFRNPFRFCFAPDGRLFAFDVGSDGASRREEINLVRAGGNYGWPLFEGQQPEPEDAAFTDPIYDYNEGGAAPVGGVYYTGKMFPEPYAGNIFHLEFVLGRLYRVVLDGDRVLSHTVFVHGEGGPVDLAMGPDGALYYCELITGRVRRVSVIGLENAGDDDSNADNGESDISGDDDTDEPGTPDEATGGLLPFAPLQLCGFGLVPALGGSFLGIGLMRRARGKN